MTLIISGATIIDCVAEKPIEGYSIWIEGDRIKAVGRHDEFGVSASTKIIDARGKYVIPGLMNANVHLLGEILMPGSLIRYMDRYEDLAIEAAQVALKNGLTTVFDTLGPRRPLVAVRDRIAAGEVQGSRVFCAGWIVGLDGILSADFNAKAAEVLGKAWIERANGLCVENVGPALTWMTPEQVAKEIRTYIGKGVDFIKYASSEHRFGDPTTFLNFSERAQTAIVEEAHSAGITAQAHTVAVEGLRVAIVAGCDLIQHCNITGPSPIPETTLELFVKRRTGAVLFPFTKARFDWIIKNCPREREYFATSNRNCQSLAHSGAMVLLANDGQVLGPDILSDDWLNNSWLVPGEDNLNALDQGHFVWFKAMEEMDMAPMEMLKAATRNIAVAYGKDKDLGTLEPGKIADMVILDKDPLQSSANYRAIHMVIKDGVTVDREALPVKPILTKPSESPSEETLAYRSQRRLGNSAFPGCPTCMRR